MHFIPVTEGQPLQLPNVHGFTGLAVSVAVNVFSYCIVHDDLFRQTSPRADITAPFPTMFAVSGYCGPVNDAERCRPLVTCTVQVDLSSASGMQPDQFPTPEPAAAVAFSVTVAPLLKRATHLVPQSMPGGELVRVPFPMPDFSTETMCPKWTVR